MSRSGSLLCALAYLSVVSPTAPAQTVPQLRPIAGPNVNMVSGREWPGGDPNLQKQNEPSIAVSTRNSLRLMAGDNDYRTLDFAGLGFTDPEAVNYDAWPGWFKSLDGGQTWRSTLVPGCSWALGNPNSPCLGSVITGSGMTAGADPTVRSGANGMFFYSFIAFDRKNRSNGAVVVSRFIDDNNREGADTIRFLDDSIVERNNAAQFTDKPYLAIDVPRPGGGTCTIPGSSAQSFPAGNIYIAYTVFLPSEQNVRAKIMFAASRDCGRTWKATKLTEENSINQGAYIAIDPGTGTVYVAWRRFKNVGGMGQVLETDNIMVAKSVNGGQTFTKGYEVVPKGQIRPFDQNTSAASLSFRTNSLPSIAVVPGGRIFLVWSENGAGTYGDARIVMSSSTDGMNWTPYVAVDNHDENSSGTVGATGRGHQITPALTFAGGKLMLAYYDLRDDHTAGRYTSLNRQMYTESRVWSKNSNSGLSDLAAKVFTLLTPGIPSITDAGLKTRHTMDVRVLQMDAAGIPVLPSTKVSQYAFGQRRNSPRQIEQLEFN